MTRRSLRARVEDADLPLHVRILLAIRIKRHWTQTDLGHALSVSGRTIRQWEAQRTAPHPAWMEAIRKLLAETEASSVLESARRQD